MYFVATTAASVSPAFQGGWISTANAARRSLATSKAAATETLQGTLGGNINDNALAVQLISPPLNGAQSVTGTYSLVSRVRELDVADNINKRWRMVYVVSLDGSTLRGTSVTNAATASTAEFSTSLTGQQHATGGTLSTVNALDGDRIVVEMGFGESTTGTSPIWETVLGGNGTDHANANGDTTGTVPWVEFSPDFLFDPEPFAPKSPLMVSQYAGLF